MTCSLPCWSHTNNQGRGCECDTNASRASLGLRPLHTKDGGHTVAGPLSFPIESEEDDQPIYTPETAAEPVPGIAQALLGFIVFALLAISAVALPAILTR